MILEPNQKILISHRRLFEKDESRYFVGEVLAYEAGIVKATGYSFVHDYTSGMIMRKDDIRTKIISLASGNYVTYQLPEATNIAQAKVQITEGSIVFTDGQHVRINLAEIPHHRHF